MGELWEKRTKRNIEFSIKNLSKLKNILDKKNINLLVVLYPWSFEIDDPKIRKKYLEFIIPLLNENEIKNISVYQDFLDGNIYENIRKKFLYNDIHYNKNGNRVIVNNLIKYLNR